MWDHSKTTPIWAKVLVLSRDRSFHRSFQIVILGTDLGTCQYMCWGHIPVQFGCWFLPTKAAVLYFEAYRHGLPTVNQTVHPPAEHRSSVPVHMPQFLLMEARMCEGDGRRGRSGPDLQSGHSQPFCWDGAGRKHSLIPQFSHRLLWLTKNCCSMLNMSSFMMQRKSIWGAVAMENRSHLKLLSHILQRFMFYIT